MDGKLWKDFLDYFQIELQIVFSIAFSMCGCINCYIIQMQSQILHYRLHFRFCERTVTVQNPFATVFPMSYKL